MAKCCSQEEQKSKRRGFLSLEEAGLVEISGLSTHERFLCRLTVGPSCMSQSMLEAYESVTQLILFNNTTVFLRYHR